MRGRADSPRLVIGAVVYLLVVTALATSAIAYLTARIGFFYRARARARAHRRAPRVALDDFFDQLTVASASAERHRGKASTPGRRGSCSVRWMPRR